MVRNASRKLKFDVQSRFYPISTVGFRTFPPNNFGQAYYSLNSRDSGSSQENKICNDFFTNRASIFYCFAAINNRSTYFLTSDLSLGELIHDENFGLFEAMSAIEMMDPKMDAGMRKRDKPGQDTKAGLVTKCHASIYF